MSRASTPEPDRCDLCHKNSSWLRRVPVSADERMRVVCTDCCCPCFHNLSYTPDMQNLPEVLLWPGHTTWMVFCQSCKAERCAISALQPARLRKRAGDEAGMCVSSPPKLHLGVAQTTTFEANTPWSDVLDSIALTCDRSLLRLLCRDIRHVIGRLVGKTFPPELYRSPPSFQLIFPVEPAIAERAVALGLVQAYRDSLDSSEPWDLTVCVPFAELLDLAPHAQLLIDSIERERLISTAISSTVENWSERRCAPWALLASLWTRDVVNPLDKVKSLVPAISVDLAQLVRETNVLNHVFSFLAAVVATPGQVCDYVGEMFARILLHAEASTNISTHRKALLVRIYLTLHGSLPISPHLVAHIFNIFGLPLSNAAILFHVIFDAYERGTPLGNHLAAHHEFWPKLMAHTRGNACVDVRLHAIRTLSAGVSVHSSVAELAASTSIDGLLGYNFHSGGPELQAHVVHLTAAFASSPSTSHFNGPTLRALFAHTVRWLAADPANASIWPIDEPDLHRIVQLIDAALHQLGLVSLENAVDCENLNAVTTAVRNIGLRSPALFRAASAVL